MQGMRCKECGESALCEAVFVDLDEPIELLASGALAADQLATLGALNHTSGYELVRRPSRIEIRTCEPQKAIFSADEFMAQARRESPVGIL